MKNLVLQILKWFAFLLIDFLIVWLLFTAVVFLLSSVDMMYDRAQGNSTEATWDLLSIIAPVVALMIAVNFLVVFRLFRWSAKNRVAQHKWLLLTSTFVLVIVFFFHLEFPLKFPGLIGEFQQESGEIFDVMAFQALFLAIYSLFENRVNGKSVVVALGKIVNNKRHRR